MSNLLKMKGGIAMLEKSFLELVFEHAEKAAKKELYIATFLAGFIFDKIVELFTNSSLITSLITLSAFIVLIYTVYTAYKKTDTFIRTEDKQD